jgi:hypothetical protein
VGTRGVGMMAQDRQMIAQDRQLCNYGGLRVYSSIYMYVFNDLAQDRHNGLVGDLRRPPYLFCWRCWASSHWFWGWRFDTFVRCWLYGRCGPRWWLRRWLFGHLNHFLGTTPHCRMSPFRKSTQRVPPTGHPREGAESRPISVCTKFYCAILPIRVTTHGT